MGKSFIKLYAEKKIILGFILAVIILVIVGVFSYRSILKFKETTQGMAQTQEIRGALGDILSGLMETEAGLRGFIITGEDRFLEPCYVSTDLIHRKIKYLRNLSIDNLDQQQRFDTLGSMIESRLVKVGEIIDLRTAKSFNPASQVALTNQGSQEIYTIRKVIEAMNNDGNKLLKQQSERTKAIAQRTTFIIDLGSVLAFTLVAAASLIIHIDIKRRKRAEIEKERLILQLQETLVKVKTLSGLLPICASCKKIRDDRGYWNQIEVYIRDHSQADFSHSMCPECMKKWYPDYFMRAAPSTG
jgi:CHASE3 domain sensor protein